MSAPPDVYPSNLTGDLALLGDLATRSTIDFWMTSSTYYLIYMTLSFLSKFLLTTSSVSTKESNSL